MTTMVDKYTDLGIRPTRYTNLPGEKMAWKVRGNTCGSWSAFGAFCEKGSSCHYTIVKHCNYACGVGDRYGGGNDYE